MITGAASGIGCHFAGLLHSRGYRLALADLNADGLDAHFTPGERMRLYHLDVTRLETWQRVLDDLLAWSGRLDTLVNSAGIVNPGYIHNADPADIARHLDINARGTIYGSKLAAEIMVGQGYGHIVNIASLAGVAPVPGISLYSASKHAVRGFSLAIAIELKPLGVDVTVVCPDLVDTPMLEHEMNYDETAIVFSGSRPLSLDEMGDALLGVMERRPLELLVPGSRGLTARLAGAIPGLGLWLNGPLSRRGERNLQSWRRRKATVPGE